MSRWKMIPDYVAFRMYMLLDFFTFLLSSKEFWKGQHSHYFVSNTLRSGGFQNSCFKQPAFVSSPFAVSRSCSTYVVSILTKLIVYYLRYKDQ